MELATVSTIVAYSKSLLFENVTKYVANSKMYTFCWVKFRIFKPVYWLRKIAKRHEQSENHFHGENIHVHNRLEARLQGPAVVSGLWLQAS